MCTTTTLECLLYGVLAMFHPEPCNNNQELYLLDKQPPVGPTEASESCCGAFEPGKETSISWNLVFRHQLVFQSSPGFLPEIPHLHKSLSNIVGSDCFLTSFCVPSLLNKTTGLPTNCGLPLQLFDSTGDRFFGTGLHRSLGGWSPWLKPSGLG